MKPTNNVFELADGQPDTGPITKPAFTLELDLLEKEFRDLMDLHDGKGVSILSKAFNSDRRSWHIKVDICAKTKNISVFVVERGEALPDEEQTLNLQKSIPLAFSSVKCQFEIVDPAFSGRKSTFFFSFAHDQNQVIGHKDMANLDQLSDSSKIKIKVSIEEYVFHSALIHHLANNFQRLFREEVAKEEALKVCSPLSVSNALMGLFHLSDQSLYWLLSSDIVKVEDEHHILSFVFQHTQLKLLRRGLPAAIQTANLIARCIRYNLLDIYNIMSALRKNEAL